MKKLNRLGDSGYNGNMNLKRINTPIDWTPELLAEYVKCKGHPIYFIETYMKIVHVDKGLIPFILHDFQKEMINSMNDNRFTAINTSRQVGKSTSTVGFLLHYILFNDAKTVAILANKGGTASEMLARLKLAYMNLPLWLQQGVVRWNEGDISLENNSKIIAAATSSDSIRGKSISCLYFDECIGPESKVTVRDKITKEIKELSMSELHSTMNDVLIWK